MANILNFSGRNIITGIGNALVDILIHEDDAFLEKTGAAKGGMTYVDRTVIEKAVSIASNETMIVSGGSACNTAVGVGKLGGKARFIGKCGEDELGRFFEKDLQKNNVDPLLFKSSSPTGRVLSIITPDAQRSMLTFLGASSEARPDDIRTCNFQDAAIVHIEGYLLFNKDLIYAALSQAKKDGAFISLDLASYTVVEESKDFLAALVRDYVDILIANEDEAESFTGYANERKALEALVANTEIAVINMGKRGSYIAGDGKLLRINAMGTGQAVDTTGAGDLWASGFLYGLVKGYPIKICGRLGTACGYEVCQVIGADIPETGWKRIQAILEEQ